MASEKVILKQHYGIQASEKHSKSASLSQA
jgi:hypothetical protein